MYLHDCENQQDEKNDRCKHLMLIIDDTNKNNNGEEVVVGGGVGVHVVIYR